MNWNPLSWFKKSDPTNRVFVSVDPGAPHVGLSMFSEGKHNGAQVCVEGITVAQARVDLCGKVLDWDRIAPNQLNAIRSGKITVSLDVFKSLFK